MEDRRENKIIGTFSFDLFNFIRFHYFVEFIQKPPPFNKGHLPTKERIHISSGMCPYTSLSCTTLSDILLRLLPGVWCRVIFNTTSPFTVSSDIVIGRVKKKHTHIRGNSYGSCRLYIDHRSNDPVVVAVFKKFYGCLPVILDHYPRKYRGNHHLSVRVFSTL